MDILGLIALARSKGSGGGSGSGTFVPSFGTLATIQTGVSWFGDDPYTLTVLVSGYTVTSNTMISVLPSVDLVEQMMADGVSNIFITNNNGVLTATAVGGAPSAAMTLQVLCSESDQVESISALPGIVGDGVLETLQATDLTDAINKLGTAINGKQDKPATAGTAGQVLGLDDQLQPVWTDQSGGGGGGGMNIVNLSGTQITQVGTDNTFYVCGELTELTFTAPSVGITMIRFTSGTTPTVLTINGVTSWMFDNDPTAASLEANKTYDINVLNGVGVVGWA